MTDAEPLEGITDAIQVAEDFLFHARAHRCCPANAYNRESAEHYRDELIAKLKKLGKQ